MSNGSTDSRRPQPDQPQPLADLTLIPGIGAKRQQWLRDVFGVMTFHDLAALPVDALEAQIKAEGRIAARSEIEGWIATATALAAEEGPLSGEAPAERAADGPLAARANPGSGHETEWAPLASFVVEFQGQGGVTDPARMRTTVHHMEADRSMVWAGIDHDQLCAWMVAQLAATLPRSPLPAPPVEAGPEPVGPEPVAPEPALPELAPTPVQPAPLAPATATAAPVPGSPPALALKIVGMEAFQPVGALVPIGHGDAQTMFSGFLQGDQPFDLEAAIDLSGPEALAFTQEAASLWMQCQALDLTSQEAIQLGESELISVQAGQLRYALRLGEVSLPSGIYRLRMLAHCRDSQTRIGLMEIPLLRVV